MYASGAGRLGIGVSLPEGSGGVVEVDFGAMERRGGSYG